MGRTQQTEMNHQSPMTSTQKRLHIHITTEELTEEEITQLEEEQIVSCGSVNLK